MRCEDCLLLIEEYFDGEVDERTSGQMRAHLSTCADCASALDALSFEQEIYTRYDRGLEVSPTLWARVSAEIAREPLPEVRDTKRPFLSRIGEAFAAALAALTVRPAFASSLALLVVGVTVGSLWLAHRPAPADKNYVAVNEGNKPPTPALSSSPSASTNNQSNESKNGGGQVVAAPVGAGPERAGVSVPMPKSGVHPPKVGPTPDDPEKLINSSPSLSALTNGTVLIGDDHATESNPVDIVEAGYKPGDVTPSSARLLDPEEKELARHVEQAQMLLRSIKNARASDEGTVNVSYEKKLSRKLLAENTTLKLDAETRGDKDTKQVLDQIEPFLLDIANLRDDASRDEVRSVKERVKKTEIIASLQVY